MLAALFHVALFVAGIIGLLAVKKKRLRHIPTRRTHISRRHAEGTIWLQRLVNASLDMLHTALAEQQQRMQTQTQTAKAPSSSQSAPGSTSPLPGKEESESESSAEVPSDLPFLNTLKAQLEEQISALLEDKGIASFADFRIKDWGGKPPVVKAIYLSHGGGSAGGGSSGAGGLDGTNNPSTNPNGAGLPTTTGSVGSPSATSVPHFPSPGGAAPSLSGGVGGTSGSGGGRSPQFGPSPSFNGSMQQHPHNSPNPAPGERGVGDSLAMQEGPHSFAGMRYRSHGVGDEASVARERSLAGSTLPPSRVGGALSSTDLTSGVGGMPLPSAAAATSSSSGTKNATDTTRSLSVLDAEVELEYSGHLSLSLNADIPIARGRYLQVYASISDVRMLAGHIRLRLALQYEPATVESPQPQPYLHGTLWLMSDPVIDVAFHSSLTQYRIRNFFLIPKLLKFFLLRFLRQRLRPSSSSSSASSSRHAAAARRRRPGAAGGGSGGSGGGASGSNAAQGTNDDGSSEAERDAADSSGLSFHIQLPADVVDGGEQWWSSVLRDTMSERPAPFPRAY